MTDCELCAVDARGLYWQGTGAIGSRRCEGCIERAKLHAHTGISAPYVAQGGTPEEIARRGKIAIKGMSEDAANAFRRRVSSIVALRKTTKGTWA